SKFSRLFPGRCASHSHTANSANAAATANAVSPSIHLRFVMASTSAAITSRFPAHQIHHPATSDMRPLSPAVRQYVGIRATGSFEGVGQVRHAVECTLAVDAHCQGDDFGRSPSGFKGDGAEGVAEDVTEQVGL